MRTVLDSNVKLYQRLGYTITETVVHPRGDGAAVLHDGETPVKTLIVGDIHGCWDEFQTLLDRAALGADDQIISVGDMVNREPDRRACSNSSANAQRPRNHGQP